jgi:two-component system sensor histidine kinase/response regulator
MNANNTTYILIVDDNPMNLMLTSHVLENEGYSSRTAENGITCIAAIDEEIPSLILLDIMMPEMDGFEVCRIINKNEKWKEIPIIFLTANAETENLVEGFNAGGVDYITKPFKKEELLVRVKNHLELAESKKTILEMNKSRDKLYSIIAHDIRSPLSGILQTIDAIDQGYFDPCTEDFKELIHHLRIRTKETSTLLSSLLQWTRLQSESIQLQPKDTDLKQVMDSCVQLLEANAHDKNIQIMNGIAENQICWCDEVSIHTIFRNIISNAIKFTPQDGIISICSEIKGSEIQVGITDTGVGMSCEVIKTIIEKNQYFSSTGTANEQGTGFGLMLVKDFVRKNNGKINIRSQKQKGTTFTITLPINQF